MLFSSAYTTGSVRDNRTGPCTYTCTVILTSRSKPSMRYVMLTFDLVSCVNDVVLTREWRDIDIAIMSVCPPVRRSRSSVGLTHRCNFFTTR